MSEQFDLDERGADGLRAASSADAWSEEADPGLPEGARRALVVLLTSRYVWRERNRATWEAVITYEEDLRQRLAEMFLDLVVDGDLGVAFKRQQDGDDIPRLLRRERAVSRDASLVMLMLLQEYACADPAGGQVVVSREQISEFLRAYRQEGDGHGAGFARRVDAAINVLESPWRLLERDPAAEFLFRVSPVIVPLLGVDELQRLRAAYEQGTSKADGTPSVAEFDDEGGEVGER